MTSEYREKQKLDDLSWYVMLAVLAAVNMYLYRYLGEKNPVHLYWSIAVLLLFGIFLAVFQLTTRYSREGLYYRLWPFHFHEKNIPWDEVEHVEIKTIQPFKDFWGFGYRVNRHATGYIMKGNQALVIRRKGQNRDLVFTLNDPEKVRLEVSKYVKKINYNYHGKKN